jgi:O-antigen/teichoic acid export membrane protein
MTARRTAPDPPPDDSSSIPDDAILDHVVSRLGSDTLRYIPAVLLPALLSFLSVSIFTRIFDPAPYGEYALVNSTVSIATGLLAGWIQQSVLRYLPRYRAEGRTGEFVGKLGSILWVMAFSVLALALILYRPAVSVLGGYGRYYLPAVVWMIAGVVFFVQNHAFRANLRSAVFSRYQVGYAVGRLVFALGFVFFVSRDVIGLVIGGAVAYLVLIGPMVFELRLFRSVKGSGFSVDTALLRKFLAYGLPVIGWVLGVKVLDLSDRFIIELFRPSSEVGIYAANYTLVSMGISFVAAPLLSAALPLIVSAWEDGHREKIQRIISTFSRYYLIAAVPVSVFAIVFARELVIILLGRDFREGHTIIPYIVAGSLLWNFAMYGHKGIKLLEKTRLMFLMVAACCAVNIGLNILVVPTYGYQGAAVTTLASFALYPVMVYFVTRRYLEWAIPWRSAGRILLAGLIAAAAWWGCKTLLAGRVHVVFAMVIGLPAGLAVYVLALAAVRELADHEMRLIGFGRRR